MSVHITLCVGCFACWKNKPTGTAGAGLGRGQEGGRSPRGSGSASIGLKEHYGGLDLHSRYWEKSPEISSRTVTKSGSLLWRRMRWQFVDVFP